MTTQRRVLVIGLDGATWDLMDPWMEAGKLPNLKRLCDTGARSVLSSTIHPITAPAWSSFLTGQQQGKHGIYDHVQRRPGTYKLELTNATMLESPTIFDYLGRHGLQSISLNVPYTFPPRPIPGLMISGLFAPTVGPEITQPPELFDEIHSVAPEYIVRPDFDPQAPDPLQTFADDLLAGIEHRFRLAEHLMETKEWALFTVVFTATDQAQHAFWHFMESETEAPQSERFRDTILTMYQAIDAGIPRLLERIEGDTLVVVMSDHGAGKVHRWVNLNRWLSDHGYLYFKANDVGQNWRTTLLKQFAASYKRYLPVGVRARIRKVLGMRFEQAKSEFESQLFTGPIVWGRSQAYSLGACGNIYINVVGREPNGIVAPGREYEQLRDEIAARLAELVDPESGERLVEQVHRREELYLGPHLERAPDLIIRWRDYKYWGRGRYDQNAPPLFESPSTWDFSELPLTGTHRPDGILMLNGEDIAAATTIERAGIVDLVPTMLAYLGLPVPTDVDGQPLIDGVAPGSRHPAAEPRAVGEGRDDEFEFTPEEEAAIRKRLEDMGYL